MNTKNKKTIGWEVSQTYIYKGKEVKTQIEAFFVYMVENAYEIAEKYPNFDIITEVMKFGC